MQYSFAFSSVRLGNPVSHPFSIALRKVAQVGAPRARWCMFTCWAVVLVLLPQLPVVLTSFVVIAVVLVFLVGGGAVGQIADLAMESSCCSRAILLLWVSMVLRAVPSVPTSDGIPSLVRWMSSILLDKVTCSPSRNCQMSLLALAWAARVLSTARWTITDTSSSLSVLPLGVFEGFVGVITIQVGFSLGFPFYSSLP